VAVSMAGTKGEIAEINITPMIDILLVLLIIFMVIVPAVPRGLQASLPQAPRGPAHTPDDPIVVQVLGHSGASLTYKINDTEVPHSELLSKLTEIFASRPERVMFVRSDASVNFAAVADVIDIGRAANVDRVGLMTAETQTGRLE
jgi:biopolymer transport protein TolR